jgi:uncharacterized protein YwqG
MAIVKEIILDDVSRISGIILGGESVKMKIWPTNPDGEPLILVATIDCAKFKNITSFKSVPEDGLIYFFSTYSRSDYFLENVTYSGHSSELDLILSGYTLVAMSESESHVASPNEAIPSMHVTLENREVNDDEYPVFSMVTNVMPNGIALPQSIQEEYEFVMQLYSADFPEPFKDIFYLSDAVGCFLLKKDKSGKGLFFVYTA